MAQDTSESLIGLDCITWLRILLARFIKFNIWQAKCWLVPWCSTIWYGAKVQRLKVLKQWFITVRYVLHHEHRVPVTHTHVGLLMMLWHSNHFTYFLSDIFQFLLLLNTAGIGPGYLYMALSLIRMGAFTCWFLLKSQISSLVLVTFRSRSFCEH